GRMGATDNGRGTGSEAKLDIARQQGAVNFRPVAERDDVNVKTGLLIKPEFLCDDRRHVDDIGRRRWYADGDFRLRRGSRGQCQRCSGYQSESRTKSVHFILPDYFLYDAARTDRGAQ